MTEKTIITQEVDIRGTPEWQQLRSEIYIRDRGICWVCNRFTLLTEYDLGHLVDFCMGGKAIYENLAVMHGYCNDIKPKHATLEEAMKWKLIPRNIINPQPATQVINNTTYPLQYPISKYGGLPLTFEERENAREAIITYFKNNPQLLSDNASQIRIKESQRLGKQYGLASYTIRKILLDEGLVNRQKATVQNDDIYHFVYNNLKNLADQYNSATCPIWDRPKKLGITAYMMRIMYYLAGHPELVDKADLSSISKRVAQLNIPIDNIFIQPYKRMLKNNTDPNQLVLNNIRSSD